MATSVFISAFHPLRFSRLDRFDFRLFLSYEISLISSGRCHDTDCEGAPSTLRSSYTLCFECSTWCHGTRGSFTFSLFSWIWRLLCRTTWGKKFGHEISPIWLNLIHYSLSSLPALPTLPLLPVQRRLCKASNSSRTPRTHFESNSREIIRKSEDYHVTVLHSCHFPHSGLIVRHWRHRLSKTIIYFGDWYYCSVPAASISLFFAFRRSWTFCLLPLHFSSHYSVQYASCTCLFECREQHDSVCWQPLSRNRTKWFGTTVLFVCAPSFVFLIISYS